jgi:hypothetical protein
MLTWKDVQKWGGGFNIRQALDGKMENEVAPRQGIDTDPTPGKHLDALRITVPVY